MDVTITIPYGGGEKSFCIDQRRLIQNVVPRLPSRPTPEQEEAHITKALDDPIETVSIRESVGAGDKVAILVDDWTRPTPAFKIAPVVLRQLNEAGVRPRDIRFLIAQGSHTPLSRRQMGVKLGGSIVESHLVENHDTRRNHAELGITGRGTPVWVNKVMMEVDWRIAIGGICAHPFAGFGGGAKIIVPGVAGIETINRNHIMADNPSASIGVANGNPVREDMEEAARIARLDFIVNVILTPKGEILEVVAGDLVKTHRVGVTCYKEIYGVRVGEKADVVILGASPRNATLHHGTFALPCAVSVVKAGGTIIWVAPCLTGPGTKWEREKHTDKPYP